MYWAVVISIVCTEPRMDFQHFMEKLYGVYPGYRGEAISSVNQRMAEGFGQFADYTVTRWERCEAPRR